MKKPNINGPIMPPMLNPASREFGFRDEFARDCLLQPGELHTDLKTTSIFQYRGPNSADSAATVFSPSRAVASSEPSRPATGAILFSAALNHDIGYVRGICAGDTAEHFVIDAGGKTVAPPRGASDAFLTPYHVERGKIKVRERFAPVPLIDEERIASAIELTRFPVPDDEDHAATDTEAGLVRAGDLIGQLGDPVYPRKLNALYHEFVETGLTRSSATVVLPIWP